MPGKSLHVVSHLDPKYGGVSAVVPQLCASVAREGSVPVELAAFCLPGEHFQPAALSSEAVSFWPTSRLVWLRDADLRRRFQKGISEASTLHIHGLWEQSTAVAARAARHLRKPYVLSAHGMLDPWALQNKKWKKRLYAALLEHRNVDGAACLHALTRAEAQNYRDFGSRQPIAIIPNGVSIPDRLDSELFLSHFPALRARRIILFLGRIHYKKGLDILVKSWATLARQHPEAYLVLAGPDSEATQATIESLIQQNNVGNQVLFTGMLRDELKWSALAAAECFVLPSYSEGLSTSVLEAMGVGLPVLVTTNCNLPEVKKHETGWEIQSTEEALTYQLRKVLENSAETNRTIGSRGKHLIHEQYDWASVARRMLEVYRWVEGGPTPRQVDLQMA